MTDEGIIYRDVRSEPVFFILECVGANYWSPPLEWDADRLHIEYKFPVKPGLQVLRFHLCHEDGILYSGDIIDTIPEGQETLTIALNFKEEDLNGRRE